MAKNIVQWGLARRLWLAYAHQLVERPILSRAFTSGTGMALGDAIAQQFTSDKPFDLHRSLKFASFGFGFHGPFCNYFYKFLEQGIYPLQPNLARAVIMKTGIDMFMASPFVLFLFFCYSQAWDGKSDQTWSTIKEKFIPTFRTQLLLWIPANAINYRLVPLNLRVLYVNVVSVGWMSILSFLTAK